MPTRELNTTDDRYSFNGGVKLLTLRLVPAREQTECEGSEAKPLTSLLTLAFILPAGQLLRVLPFSWPLKVVLVVSRPLVAIVEGEGRGSTKASEGAFRARTSSLAPSR